MEFNSIKVLLVDDEDDILEFLSYNFKKEGFIVKIAKNGYDSISIAKEFRPDIILLDIMMPGIDGIEVCSELRKLKELENTVIIMLSARCEEYSQLAGFECGADDYICKPVKPRLLISRIKAILNRINRNENKKSTDSVQVTSGGLVIDRDKYIVIFKGTSYELPRKEFELLSLLSTKPDKVFTRNEIYKRIWGENIIDGNRTIDVHIRRIRNKLNADFIKTVKGVGYKFMDI